MRPLPARSALVTSVVVLALAAAGCAQSVDGQAVPASTSSAPPARPARPAEPIQMRPVLLAEPVGSHTCQSTTPDIDAVAEVCDQERATWYRLGPSITHEPVRNAQAGTLQGQYVVTIELAPQDSASLAQHTAAHIGDGLAMVVGSRVITAPTIRSAIPGGKVEISGNYTAQSARDLAEALKPS